jgi:hypothetical protein
VPGTSTRATDWLDLMVPYAVLGPLGLAFAAAGLSRRRWWVAAGGAVMYASGHGIHLAANSIANLSPTGAVETTAHLWDEVVGHLIWYAGAALLLAVAATVLTRLAPAPPMAHAVALAVGATWGTNAVGGGTSVLSAATALALVACGLRHQSSAALVLVPRVRPGARRHSRGRGGGVAPHPDMRRAGACGTGPTRGSCCACPLGLPAR